MKTVYVAVTCPKCGTVHMETPVQRLLDGERCEMCRMSYRLAILSMLHAITGSNP